MLRIQVVIIALLMFSGCSMDQVDLIVYNAKIYTVDKDFSTVEAMAIKDGRIVQTGNSKTIQSTFNATESIDAFGKTIFPGFTDAHCHFWGYANNLNHANLNGAKSFNEVVEILNIHDKKYKSDWISGRGWDQNDWDIKEFPTNSILEKVFPGKAIVLTRVDGHAVLASQKAIELSGIDIGNYPDEMVIRNDGELTGVFLEAAGDVIKSAVPKPSGDELIALLKQAEKNCYAVGLTKVYDAGLSVEEVDILDALYQKNHLSIGVDVWLNPEEKNLPLIEKGPQLEGDLTISAIKLYADGALGSRGACMIEPYSDKNTSGVIVENPDFFRKWCKIALEHNLQVATHCIGDSANRLMLNIYGEFLQGKNDKRWRIEHAQVVHPTDVAKYAQFSIHPSVQPTHCTSDMYWAGERLGERIKNAYIYQTLLKQNGWLAAGSDFPVEDINPLYGFYAAVSRKDQKAWPEHGFQKDEALSREQALKAMTIWAAKSNFTEKVSGSLESGKQADFVILDNDIMTSSEEKLFSTQVLKTFKHGVLVFENK